MAELDYAFLADHASITPQGTLNALGASFTFLRAGGLPIAHRMGVAGRVRGHMDEPPIGLKIELEGPEGTPVTSASADLVPGDDPKPYGEGILGHLFAMDVNIALVSAGMYWVKIALNGQEVRKLGFEVMIEPPPA